jgi:hypothetical protein
MRTRPFTRRIAGFGAALTLLAGLGLIAAPAAHALSTVVCPAGTAALTFDPGVTLTPRFINVHADATFAPCVSTTNPGIVSATASVTASGTLSCLTGATTGTQRISWSDGSHSDISFTGVVGVQPGGQKAVVITGKVTGGAFVGGTVAETLIFITTQSLQCLTPKGITSGGGPATITIIT